MPRSHNLALRWSRTTAKSVDTLGHKAPRVNRFPQGCLGSNPSRGVLIFINGYSFLYLMGNTLNTTFVILLVITLILFTFYYIIIPTETEEEFGGFKEITGMMQSFEVFHESPDIYYPTKKNTKRYNDKLFDYLDHIQGQRDKTFHKGKVFLKER